MTFGIDEAVYAEPGCELLVILRGREIAVAERTAELGRHQTYLSCVIPSGHLSSQVDSSTSLLSIGQYHGTQVALWVLRPDEAIQSKLSFVHLREFLSIAGALEANIASRAAQLAHWHASHRFCSTCGSALENASPDRSFACSNCGFRMYPRISPCVIGVVTRGRELLLVHGRNNAKAIYSAVAGFIEAGETPEQAFAREVKEEVDIEIQDIEYVESQTWPFPGQLMLGFLAHYKAGSIKIDETEITDAAWFDRSELPTLPPAFAISAKLINHAIARME